MNFDILRVPFIVRNIEYLFNKAVLNTENRRLTIGFLNVNSRNGDLIRRFFL